MALPPTIPTSFVPRQPVHPLSQRPVQFNGNSAFALVAYFIGAVAVIGAIGIFAYGYYVNGVRDTEATQLINAQKGLSQNTVENFIRLRDRLASANTLLDTHVTLSPLFDALEKITLQTVRFTSFRLAVLDDHSGTLEMAGTARTFNALAAQAEAMNAESRIKRSVFSNIGVQKDGTVNFTLTATLDSRLISGNYSSTVTNSSPTIGTMPVTVPVDATPTTSSATTAPNTGGAVTPPVPAANPSVKGTPPSGTGSVPKAATTTL